MSETKTRSSGGGFGLVTLVAGTFGAIALSSQTTLGWALLGGVGIGIATGFAASVAGFGCFLIGGAIFGALTGLLSRSGGGAAIGGMAGGFVCALVGSITAAFLAFTPIKDAVADMVPPKEPATTDSAVTVSSVDSSNVIYNGRSYSVTSPALRLA